MVFTTLKCHFSFKKDLFYVYVVYLCVCLYLMRSEEGVRSLELELQAVVNLPMWVLGAELRSSENS